MGSRLLVASVGLWAACVRPDQQFSCGEAGVICPGGMECWAERNVCVDPAGLTVADTTYDFGRVACGRSAELAVELQNTGATDVEFTARSTLAGIRVTPEVGIVPSGASLTLTLTALPVAEALPGLAVEGMLEIETYRHVIARPITLTLAGGIASTAPTFSFGEAALGEPVQRDLVIANTGDAPFGVSVFVAGEGFSLTSNALGITVPPLSSESVELGFHPTTLRGWSGSLALTYDQPLCQAPLDTIALSGIATGDGLLADRSTVTFHDAACGAPAENVEVTLESRLGEAQTLTAAVTGPDAEWFRASGAGSIASTGESTLTVQRLAIPGKFDLVRHEATLEITATPSGETKEIPLAHTVAASVLEADTRSISFNAGVAGYGGGFRVSNRGNAVAYVTLSPASLTDGNTTLSLTPNPFMLEPEKSQLVRYTITPSAVADTQVRGNVTVHAAGACSPPQVVTFDVKVPKGEP